MRLSRLIMLPLLSAVMFAWAPASVAQDASDVEKQEFIELLKTLPHKAEFFTEVAISKAGPYLPVLLSLTDKDLEKYDLYPFAAISSGLASEKKHCAYVLAHFPNIRHAELKLLWAVLLFNAGDVSPEAVHYLRDALSDPQRSQLLGGMVGPDFKFFKRKVRNHPYAIESGKQDPPQPEEEEGHADWVTSVAFSPNGEILISGSHDGTLILWEISSGKQLRSIEGHRLHGRPFEIVSVAYSPDGRTVASASSDKTVRLWNSSTGVQLRVFADLKFAQEIIFSPNGKRLAAANCETVLVWNLTTGVLVRSFRKAPTGIGGSYCAGHVAFSPDSNNIIADGGPIQVWNIPTGREIRRFEPQGSGLGMALSPDGKQLLLGEDFENSQGLIELWDLAGGKLLRRFSAEPNTVECVGFSPDGKIAATESHEGNDIESAGSIKLWNLATGAELRKLTGHKRRVAAIAFAPDGKTLASGSWDHSVKLWDVATGQEIHSFPSTRR